MTERKGGSQPREIERESPLLREKVFGKACRYNEVGKKRAFYFLSPFVGRCMLVLSERRLDLLKILGLAEFPLKMVAPAGLFLKVLAGRLENC